MNISKGLMQTLKNFATINPGIHLKPGDFIMTRSPCGATYAEVHLQPEDTIPFDVAIYDLNAFLSILSLSGEDSDIKVEGPSLIIKGKRSKIMWPACDPTAIVSPKNAIKFPPASFEFDLAADEYNQLMKISRGLGANTLAFTNKDDTVVVNAFNSDIDATLERPLSTYKVADYDGTADFNFIIKIVNLKLLAADYKVKLWAQGNRQAARFESEAANYVIAVEDESTHGF